MRLPKAFRFPGSEVLVERRGDEVELRAKPDPGFKTLGNVARHMAKFGGGFPDQAQPDTGQERDLTW